MGNTHNMTIVTRDYCPRLNHSEGFQQPRLNSVQLYLSAITQLLARLCNYGTGKNDAFK